ncbi:MAG TPA: hypothetical protein VK707_09990 [Solirubrobacteraceae bacterium]|jgi:hypothetical protein|nr:hypothetical protein [Solirubrobacteraceae bacterium]
MLFYVIPIAWLGVVTLLIAVCRAASDGDANGSNERGAVGLGERIVLHDGRSAYAAHARRAHPAPLQHAGRGARAAHIARRRRFAGA